jgi:hypothetical protein
VSERTESSGLATVDLAMSITGGARGTADVMLVGQPLASGGVSVESSRVTLGPKADPTRYRGSVVQLDGTRFVADLQDRAGHALRADFRVALEAQSVRGTVSIVHE